MLLARTNVTAAGPRDASGRDIALNRYLAAAGVALLCGLALQIPHLFLNRAHDSADWAFHYNLAREYAGALQLGDWWPRWSHGAQYGLGDPAPLYYAPLYYMIVAQVARLTGNVWIAMQAVEIGAAVIMGLAVYALAARYSSHRWGLLAIVLAVFSPMLCLLHLGLNAYAWACALAPVAVLQWALLRPAAEGRVINLPAIVALAAAIMTHIVTGLMAVIVVGALVLGPLFARRRPVDVRGMATPIVTILLALGLAAAYLYPAYSLQTLINPEFLRGLHNPLATFALPLFSGMQAPLIQWPVSLLLVAPAVAALWRLRPLGRQRWLVSATLLVAASAVLSTELSAPLWMLDTPLHNVQFPFRFMAILVPLTPVLTVVALAYCQRADRWFRTVLAALAVSAAALALVLVAKACSTDGRVIDTRETQFPPYRGLEEYRTRASLGTPLKGGEGFDWNARCREAKALCGNTARTRDGLIWTVTSETPVRLVLPVYEFPAWQVSINGVARPSAMDRETGLVAVKAPAGRNDVTLRWRRLPEEVFGIWLSLATAVLLSGLTFVQRRGPRRD